MSHDFQPWWEPYSDTEDGLVVISLVTVTISIIILVRRSIFRVGSIQLEMTSFIKDQVRPLSILVMSL